MNKIKLYLIIGAVLFVAASVVTVNIQSGIIKKRNETIDRLRYNESELLKDNDNLVRLELTQKELTGKLLRERDSLAEVLKVRPKQIVSYSSRLVFIRITDPKKLELTPIPFKPNINQWSFSDTINKCTIYSGVVSLVGGVPEVTRTNFEDKNIISDVTYKYRTFPIFGKLKYERQVVSTCGDPPIVTEITIRKK